MTDQIPLADNGRTAYHSAPCPNCGHRYSWPSGLNPQTWLTCVNETERGTKCGTKLKVMEWEYYYHREKRNAKVSG